MDNIERPKSPIVDYPGPMPEPDFESWLAEQQDRQDVTGAIARFIIWDLERGCWPTSNSIDAKYTWWGTEKAHERQIRAFRSHLACEHNVTYEHYVTLDKAFKEYVTARDDASKRWSEWMNEHGVAYPPVCELEE